MRKKTIVLAILILILFTALYVVPGLAVDYWWFESIGHLQVFMTNLEYQVLLFFIGWISTSFFLLLTWRNIKKALKGRLSSPANNLFKFFSIIIGFAIGSVLSGKYLIVLSFLNQTSWGVADPIFNQDVSFYVFTLPFIETILSFVAAISALVLISSVSAYVANTITLEADIGGTTIIKRRNGLISTAKFFRSRLIIGSLVVLISAGAAFVWLGRFSYLWGFSPGAPVPTHADYMATNYLIPYTWILSLGVVLLGSFIIYGILKMDKIRDSVENWRLSNLKKEIALLAIVVVILFIIPTVVFGAINNFSVRPNEPGIQEPYLGRAIEFTNMAYNLDDVVTITYLSRSNDLTAQEALGSPTVKNARIVDYMPTMTSYEAKQRLRAYYDFYDVDVDRYLIENEKQLVFISGREVEVDYGEGWQNQNLFFTHGFGAVVSPANTTEVDGSPVLSVKDIPPISEWRDIDIKDPRIYFGEMTDDYAIVNAYGLDEFDYPLGETNVDYRYEFDRGIKLDSFLKKLFIWSYTGDLEIMASGYLASDSKILLHRNVYYRVEKIAPFLRYDSDAQTFVGKDGGLYYIINGITAASRYPYSYNNFNAPGYLSDSVKAFVKSDTGDVQFYIVNDGDPMVRTYSKIYPNLFINGNEMSEDFKGHLIYPPSLFETQMKIFSRYHMSDYQAFYQNEDLWSPGEERYHGAITRVEPYNILLDVSNIPGLGSSRDEFTLIQPFTPAGKQNMRAWVGVAQDPGNYGKMVALEFPKGELERGPIQVEAIIDQTGDISTQFTLWEGAGSTVLRGNLLVLPVEGDILYIEPVYLSAETAPYPQLRRVVAVYKDKAVMEDSLEKAVAAVLGGKISSSRVENRPVDNRPVENTYKILVQIVREHLELSEDYFRLMSEGQYAEAGAIFEEMVDLEEEMKKLVVLLP